MQEEGETVCGTLEMDLTVNVEQARGWGRASIWPGEKLLYI